MAVTNINLIQNIHEHKKDSKIASIDPNTLLLPIFNNLFDELRVIYNSQSNLKGSTKIFNNIIKKFENELLSDVLKAYLKQENISIAINQAVDHSKIRYVHRNIINLLNTDNKFNLNLKTPLRINKQFSDYNECLSFAILILENKCTNIDIDDTTIQSKLQSLNLKNVNFEKYIATTHDTAVCKINHNNNDK